jgi:hypothetical protein
LTAPIRRSFGSCGGCNCGRSAWSASSAAADPFPGEALSLQPCTIPGRTLWIIATALSPATAPAKLFPIVSGATRDFAHPFTMTYPRHVDTNKPLPPIRLRHLKLRDGAGVPRRQLWGVTMGPLHY